MNYLSVTIAGLWRTMNEEIEDEVNQRRRVGRLDDFKEEKFWRGDARRQPIDVRKGGWTVGLALLTCVALTY